MSPILCSLVPLLVHLFFHLYLSLTLTIQLTHPYTPLILHSSTHPHLLPHATILLLHRSLKLFRPRNRGRSELISTSCKSWKGKNSFFSLFNRGSLLCSSYSSSYDDSQEMLKCRFIIINSIQQLRRLRVAGPFGEKSVFWKLFWPFVAMKICPMA